MRNIYLKIHVINDASSFKATQMIKYIWTANQGCKDILIININYNKKYFSFCLMCYNN